MITVRETTKWTNAPQAVNHLYILSDDKQLMYAYVKWGVNLGDYRPTFFNKPIGFDPKGRTFVTLLKTRDVEQAIDSTRKTWKIAGSKGDVYTVSEFNGTFTCTCPNALYRHQVCKHINQVKQEAT